MQLTQVVIESLAPIQAPPKQQKQRALPAELLIAILHALPSLADLWTARLASRRFYALTRVVYRERLARDRAQLRRLQSVQSRLDSNGGSSSNGSNATTASQLENAHTGTEPYYSEMTCKVPRGQVVVTLNISAHCFPQTMRYSVVVESVAKSGRLKMRMWGCGRLARDSSDEEDDEEDQEAAGEQEDGEGGQQGDQQAAAAADPLAAQSADGGNGEQPQPQPQHAPAPQPIQIQVARPPTRSVMTKRSPGFRGFGALLVSVCTKVRDETSPLQAWLDNTTPTSNTASADPNSSDATAETPIVPTISITSPADAEPDPARDTAAASDEADVPPSPSESGAVARSAAPLPLPPTLRQHMALRQTDFRNISAFLRRGWATLSDHIPSALIPAYGTLFRHIFATYSSVVDRPSMSMDTHLQMALLSQTWRVVDVLAPASGRDMRLCRDPTCCAAALAASISCSTWSYPAYSRYGLGAQRPCAACQLADDGDRRDSGVGSESSSSLPLETRASAGSDVCDVDSPAATTPPMPDQPAPAGRDACTCKGSFTLCRTESPRSMLSLGLDDSNGVCEHLLWEGTFGRLSVVRHPFRLAHDSVLTLVCLAHGDTGDQQVSVVDLEMDVSPRWLAEHVYNQMGY